MSNLDNFSLTRRVDDRPLAQAVPLCVDLDGTLIRTDVLVEGIFASATSARLYRAVFELCKHGRAAFKHAVAAVADTDPSLLPYNQTLLAYLGEQAEQGRRLLLVTAADRTIADRVAAHLGIFEAVIASENGRNLKGRHKAEALVERFGRSGFSYVGDSRADLEVWRFARGAVVVNAGRSTVIAARALTDVEREISDTAPPWRGLLKATRPHQWVKNLLVFVPLFISGARIDVASAAMAVIVFLAFCATASGIYLLNDLTDLTADRQHPRKRRRPFASGAVSLPLGFAVACGLVGIGALLAAQAGVFPIVTLYALMSVSYSAKLKELPLVDTFMLAALYSIRLVSGGEATGHRVSLWLVAFSSFLFLSLAFVKRVGELASPVQRVQGQDNRRGYEAGDIGIMQMFGCGCSVAASLVLALFIQSEATGERYASPTLLWVIVPLVLFWQCRIWLSTARGYMLDDPIVYAARDWVSWSVALTAALIVVTARSSSILN